MIARPISCAFDRLYPAGAGFPEPDLLMTGDVTEDASGFGIHFLAEIFPAQSYGTGFSPDIFVRRSAKTDAMEQLYRDIAIKAVSPTVLVRIERALVAGAIVYADTGETRLIYETQRPNDRAATLPPDDRAIEQATDFQPSPDTDYLFLTSPGSSNYGHVLVDDLPRLKALSFLRRDRPGRRLGVIMTTHGSPIDRVRHEAVSMIGGEDVEVRFIEHNRVHRIDNLLYASPCSSHPIMKNPHAVSFLRSAVADRDDGPGTRGRRLFVGRSPGQSRQMTNSIEVTRRLGEHGYDRCFPETLTFKEQVRLFRSSDQVIGQMGAAMTNTLFCPPGSSICYLAPDGWIEPFYWDLSMVSDHRYRVLFGATEEAGDPAEHLKNFRIDLDDLSAVLGLCREK